MEIYLVRHTTPAVEKGVCYGQANLDVTESFHSEAAIIRQHLPENATAVYSSPLMRCKILAAHLYGGHPIHLKDELMEINCGNWELKVWDEIPKHEIDPWMKDLLNVRIPAGESYTDVYERVKECFNKIVQLHQSDNSGGQLLMEPTDITRAVIVAHGGVIRSILSHITDTPLVDSFKVFTLHYGCVIKIVQRGNGLQHEILSNIPHEKETHKPTNL
jgi:alpha-ribazole phosphatase